MAAKTRLTLSTIGAPDLLDVTSPAPDAPVRAALRPIAVADPGTGRDSASPELPAEELQPQHDVESPVTLISARGQAESHPEGNLLRGAPRRRSLSLDADLHTQLSDTAASAGVGLSTLVVALLARGLDVMADVAEVVVAERIRRVDIGDQRIRLQMPIPGRLAARLEDTLAEARRRSPRATAADLANGILAEELPAPEAAGRIVADYRRRIEQLALSPASA